MLTGFYIILGEGVKRTSRPGRDDDYNYEEWILGSAYDENGNEIVYNEWPSNAKEVYALGKYPMEMGNGLVCYDNAFYDLESLKIRFVISNNFIIKSIFQNGLIELEFVVDSRDYIIKVQEERVVDLFDINEFDKMTNNLIDTNDNKILEFLNPSYDVNKEQTNLIYEKTTRLRYKKEELIRDRLGRWGACLKDKDMPGYNVNYDNSLTLKKLTKQLFVEGKEIINSKDLEIINEIHHLLLTSAKGKVNIDNTFLYAKSGNWADYYGFDCQFFFDFFIIKSFSNNSNSLSRFYDYKGRELSKKVYECIHYPQKDFNNKYYDFYSHVFVFYNRDGKEYNSGIIIVENGQLKEIQLDDYHFLQRPLPPDTKPSLTIFENFIKYNSHYYNFKGEELSIMYTDVYSKNVIKGIIKTYSPQFFFSDYCDYDKDDNIVHNYSFEPLFSNGKILLPNVNSFESCMKKLKTFHKSISGLYIEHIGNYISNEGAPA